MIFADPAFRSDLLTLFHRRNWQCLVNDLRKLYHIDISESDLRTMFYHCFSDLTDLGIMASEEIERERYDLDGLA